MADALLKYETIDADQIDDIMAGAEPREPKIGTMMISLKKHHLRIHQ